MKVILSFMMSLALMFCFASSVVGQKAETKSQHYTQTSKEKDKKSTGQRYQYLELKIIRDLKGNYLHADIDFEGMERDLKMTENSQLRTTFMSVRKASSEMQALNMLGEHGFQISAHRKMEVLKNPVTSYIMMRIH